MKTRHGTERGFTLVELVIVMTVLAILAALAYPAYNSSLSQARRSDGKSALMDIMSKEERYFTENNTYTTDLSLLPADSASKEGFYTIAAAACGAGISSCVKLTATPGGIQSADGALSLDSRGVKTPADKW